MGREIAVKTSRVVASIVVSFGLLVTAEQGAHAIYAEITAPGEVGAVFSVNTTYEFQASMIGFGDHLYYVWWYFDDDDSSTEHWAVRGNDQVVVEKQTHTFATTGKGFTATFYVWEPATDDEWVAQVGFDVINLWLTSQTKLAAADGIAPNSRQTVGICEQIDITAHADPDGVVGHPTPLFWSVEGGGTVTQPGPNDDPMKSTFTAPGSAATCTVKARVGIGADATLAFTVVVPAKAAYVSKQDQEAQMQFHTEGPPDHFIQCRTAYYVQVDPMNVNFHNCWVRENVKPTTIDWPEGGGTLVPLGQAYVGPYHLNEQNGIGDLCAEEQTVQGEGFTVDLLQDAGGEFYQYERNVILEYAGADDGPWNEFDRIDHAFNHRAKYHDPNNPDPNNRPGQAQARVKRHADDTYIDGGWMGPFQ